MSQYVQFFIKTKDNLYYPIGSFSRNTMLGQAFADKLPYESLKPITTPVLDEANADLKIRIENIDKAFTEIEDKIKFIQGTNNPISEKIDSLNQYIAWREEIQEEKDALLAAVGYLGTIRCMLDEAVDDEDYYSEKESYDIKEDSYVFGGWEVGNPNVTYENGIAVKNRITGYRND